MDNYIGVNDSTTWSELATPVKKSEESIDTTLEESLQRTDKVKQKNRVSTPILSIQLSVCLIILTVLFLLNTFNPVVFSKLKSWYDSELTADLYFNGDFSSLDYSLIFNSTDDEI